MSIRTQCRKCGRILNVPGERKGTRVRCRCGNRVTVEASPSGIEIPRGAAFFEYVGKARLDRSEKKIRRRFPGIKIKRFLAFSSVLHFAILAAIFIAGVLGWNVLMGKPPARENSEPIELRVVVYDLDGNAKTKHTYKPLEDFHKGIDPKNPGLQNAFAAENPMDALKGAETNPDRIDPVDTSPSKKGEKELAPASPESEAEAAEKKNRQQQREEVAQEEKKDPAQVDDAKDSEPLDDKLDRLVGYGEEKKRKSKITFVPEEKTDPKKKSKYSRAKSFSYTQWKKFLRARAVIGLDGGKGSEGMVNPGGGSPRFFGTPLSLSGKRVVFVLDYSPSMVLTSNPFPDLDGTLVGGNKLDRAKTELKRAVASLKEDVAFNIIFFNHQSSMWKKIMLKASDENKDAAFAYIDQFQPAGEGTDVTSAVLKAFNALCKKGSIVLLTDGSPNSFRGRANEESAADKSAARILEANVHRIPIYSFGFFHDHEKEAGRKFLSRLSKESGGSFIEVK